MKRSFIPSRLRFIPVLAFFFSTLGFCAPPSALFYMTDPPDSIQSFLAHADKIDLLVPAWYHTDENGLVAGSPNPLVLDTAKKHGVPVMPILALFKQKAVQ